MVFEKIVQVCSQAFCCMFCTERSDKENKATSKTVLNNNGDALEQFELQNNNELEGNMSVKNVVDAWTMTIEPSTLDTATSPPSPSWKNPLISKNKDELGPKDFSREFLRRNRMISVDPVGSFVGGVASFPTSLEITADELDTARKRLRRSSCDSNSSFGTAPKILPIVFEDNDEDEDLEEGAEILARKQSVVLENQRASSDTFNPNAASTDKNIEIPIIRSGSDEKNRTSEFEGSDDVFVPIGNNEIISVELHSEPPNNQLLSVSSLACEASDTSKASTTEEELIDRFYNKLEVLKRCGHKLIDDRKITFSNDPETTQHYKSNSERNDSQIDAELHVINTPGRPPMPSTSPPKLNESTVSVAAKFASMKIDERGENKYN